MTSAFENTLALLRARRAFGPTCGWCEAAAQDYEAEYAIDHDASSDFLMFADQQRTACRAGLHVTAERFARQFSYLHVTRWPWWHRPVAAAASAPREQRDA